MPDEREPGAEGSRTESPWFWVTFLLVWFVLGCVFAGRSSLR